MIDDLKELHWLMDTLQSIDVGLIVLDKDNHIKVWNSFMENHSNQSSDFVRDKELFELFPDINQHWFRQKLESVFLLKNRAFSTWEQRPYLFRFQHYRPFTGTEPHMYQNLTLIPLASATGEVNHACVIIYDVTEVAAQKKQLQTQHHKLKEMTRRDSLTGLYVRHYWDERLANEFERYSRNHIARTLVMFDIDNLKEINETFGYDAGDLAITQVSDTLTKTQRNTDFSGRYGGDKMVILLTDVDEANSVTFAERFRKTIEQQILSFNGNDINITISLGIAESSDDYESPHDWVHIAEQAMQVAKENGRNQVALASGLS